MSSPSRFSDRIVDALPVLRFGAQERALLERLEATPEEPRQVLVEKAKVKGGRSEEAASEEDDGAGEEAEAEEAEGEPAETAHEEPALRDDTRGEVRRRALAWVERADLAARLVRTSKKRGHPRHQAEVEQAKRQLLARVMLPGGLYVVRRGGTRKGAGEERWAERERHSRAILGDAAIEARFGKGAKPPAVRSSSASVSPARPGRQGKLFD